jgi:glycosyltransferase involved in cell wall biosynthesis
MKKPKDSHIVVLACARDVERDIEKFYMKFRQIFKSFQRLNVVVFESYSSDSTLQICKSLEVKNSDFKVLNGAPGKPGDWTRTERIAYARNKNLEYARKHFPDCDYVAVADVDGVNQDLNEAAMLTCWELDDWDMMSANQPFRYYDLWALRHPFWNPSDHGELYSQLAPVFGEKNAVKLAYKSREFSIHSKTRPIPVISAFGGIAIYRAEIYFKSKYEGLNDYGEMICEHVPFNTYLAQDGARLFINPSFVNLRPITQKSGILKNRLKIAFKWLIDRS